MRAQKEGVSEKHGRVTCGRPRLSYGWKAAFAGGIFLPFLFLINIYGCGGVQIHSYDADDWRGRGLWVEEKDGQTNIMVVGRDGNASLGEGFAFNNAEQDARARLSLYVENTAEAFRRRLQRRMDLSLKRVGESGVVAGGQTTGVNDVADQSVARNVGGGLETVDSFRDDDADMLYVLARVRAGGLREVLLRSFDLTDEQRELILENSSYVRDAMEGALREAYDDYRKKGY